MVNVLLRPRKAHGHWGGIEPVSK